MDFEKLRVKTVVKVLRYRPNIPRWTADNRKDHIMGIQVSGRALHTMDNQSLVLSENCIFFLNQRDDYQVVVYEPCEAFSIHFTTYEEIDTDSFCVSVQNANKFVSILQKAEIAKLSQNEFKLLASFYELCEAFDKTREKPYAPKDRRMVLAKTYIDRYFREEKCLEVAIDESKLGQRRFRDLFQQVFDITPRRYIMMKKIEDAKNLLSAGGVSVTEVSELCGFSDVYYFSKVFKQLCGVSPTQFVKQYKSSK